MNEKDRMKSEAYKKDKSIKEKAIEIQVNMEEAMKFASKIKKELNNDG